MKWISESSDNKERRHHHGLLVQADVTGAPGATRTFDALDRLTSAYAGGGTTTYLAYDALDRLASIQVGAGGPLRRPIWNGDELAGERTGADPIIWGNGPDGAPVTGADFTGGVWRGETGYRTDERGSLIGETGAAGLVRAYAYDAWGRETGPHPGLTGYAGGIALPGAGLTHFRARAYDPGTGRWVSADPIGVAGGINLYGYAGGDPVNRVDPSGLQSTCGAASCNFALEDGDGQVSGSRWGSAHGFGTGFGIGIDGTRAGASRIDSSVDLGRSYDYATLTAIENDRAKARQAEARAVLGVGGASKPYQQTSTGSPIFRAIDDVELLAMSQNGMRFLPSTGGGLEVKYFWPKLEYAFAFGREYVRQGWVNTSVHIVASTLPPNVRYSVVNVADLSKYGMRNVYTIVVPNSELLKIPPASVVGYVPFKN